MVNYTYNMFQNILKSIQSLPSHNKFASVSFQCVGMKRLWLLKAVMVAEVSEFVSFAYVLFAKINNGGELATVAFANPTL